MALFDGEMCQILVRNSFSSNFSKGRGKTKQREAGGNGERGKTGGGGGGGWKR